MTKKNKDGGMIMKRIAYVFAALAAIFVTSCAKENEPVDNGKAGKAYTLRASIEDPATKATLSGTSLLWSGGDKIGVYVPDFGTKNQPFTLVGDGGSATGEFKYDYDNGVLNSTQASAAFFPWNGTGSDVNNVYEGTMYFKMPDSYTNYTSGKMLVPLVAKMTYNSATEEYEDLAFKYVGGVVWLSISNVPGAAHSLGMTVSGKNVHGEFSVNPADAGTATWVAGDGNNSTIWLNMATAEADRAFDFVFPVPTLASPTLTFQMYDKNDVLIWKRTASNQPSVVRASVLDFSNVEINAVPRGLYLAGYINGADVYTTTDENYKFKTNKNGGATLSLTLNQDSYVLLNYSTSADNTGNGDKRYLASSYVESATSATMSVANTNYDNKLKVPAGDVVFTVTYNTDGSLNLSYVSTPHHDYVDLGLSVKWATMNVGASKPEDDGDYFAWGETAPKSTYSSATYLYTDNPTTLPSDNDAASVNWGNSWRMPTDAEWTELRENCTSTWITQNGVNGRLVTASNGNSIFLPAAGLMEDSTLRYFSYDGYYWSSSLVSNLAYGAQIMESGLFRYHDGRNKGMSIRPVYAK